MDVFSIILTCVYIVVGLALIWFVVELALTMRKVRSTVQDLEPTLDNVEKMVTDLQPTITKVDPLMDRVTLTVDSVNLELMRVDGILENVTKITGGVSKTVVPKAISRRRRTPSRISWTPPPPLRRNHSAKNPTSAIACAPNSRQQLLRRRPRSRP